jgi:hypothetical protein
VAKRRERRRQLEAQHRQLLGIKLGAIERLEHERSDECAWAALSVVYRDLPTVQAELDRLESL